MSIHIVYLVTHDGHEAGKSYNVERTLGVRLCENKIAIPYTEWIDRQAKAAAEKKEAENAAAIQKQLEKKKEEDAKKLKADFDKNKEKAISRKEKKKEKSDV